VNRDDLLELFTGFVLVLCALSIGVFCGYFYRGCS
jgi:hypothetical protein